MKQGGFLRMSPSNFAILTDNFCEELVKYILIQGETNERQSELIKVIKDKYGKWRKYIGDITWDSPYSGKNYPKYLDELDFKIACGDIIEEDSGMIGSWDDEILITEPVTRIPIYKEDEELQARIEEKEEENEKLKHQLEEAHKSIKELEEENEQQRAQVEECRNQLQTIEKQGSNSDEWVVELLSYLCYGDEQVARSILDDIRGKEDPVIADIIYERKQQNQISPKAQNREIWRILHAAKLYRSIEGNFNTALRRRKQ